MTHQSLNISSSKDKITTPPIHPPKLRRLVPFLLIALFSFAAAVAANDRIRLNQIGFHTCGPKIAIIADSTSWYFSIKSQDLSTTWFTAELSASALWTPSGEKVKVADFSRFNRPGTYVVHLTGTGASHPFTISDDVFTPVTRGLIRAFYYQRASTMLPRTFAGVWSRAAGHSDTRVFIHESAQSDPIAPAGRKTDEFYPSPGGWYDAGDYGKYVVNAGITTYQLLLLYEQFPEYFDALDLNIPESGNQLPDLLDEIKWELDWLLTMQDPADGGVYHKLTSKTFCGDIMPERDNETRYFIGKGSAATFDFAAVCAVAGRVYRDMLPSFADSCINAAKYAWEWGSRYPDSLFKNPSDIFTGEYGDKRTSDEELWAACELFITTGDSAFRKAVTFANKSFDLPSWPGVGLLACFSMAFHKGDSTAMEKIITHAQEMTGRIRKNPFRTAMTGSDFYWGSNSVAANQGTVMLAAYLLTKEPMYLEGAIHACDYIFGRNGTGYCFVTGFGSRSPLNPHHRPSTADGYKPPVPGFLVGGPSSQAGGDCTEKYPARSAKAWLDLACSYSTNEIAINWNSAAALLAGGVEAVFSTPRFDLTELEALYAPDTASLRAPSMELHNIRPDRVTIIWRAAEPVVATIALNYDPSTKTGRRIHCLRADSSSVTVIGLLPETLYRITCSVLDDEGNRSAALDSFVTEKSSMNPPQTSVHNSVGPVPGSDCTLSFTGDSIASARLFFSVPGIGIFTPITASVDGDRISATIPGDNVTPCGFTYYWELVNGTDTLVTRISGAAPETLSLLATDFAPAKSYCLASLPGLFAPQPSKQLFFTALGDTAQWKFFGYDTQNRKYLQYDTVRSGMGGWLCHTEAKNLEWQASGITPDTLFPVCLRKGWNCVGNPFPFPVRWDNAFVDIDGTLLRVSDQAASYFVRRQFFGYVDTTADLINNGFYRSNRHLTSHVYNDSVSINPWEGFWVFAQRDSVSCLLDASLPDYAFGAPAKQLVATQPKSWFCEIEVLCDRLVSCPIALGASELAGDGYDEFDSPCPPSPVAGLRAVFSHPEWSTACTGFASDIKEYDMVDARRWEIDVECAMEKPLVLRWRMIGKRDGDLTLIDETDGHRCLMDSAGSFSFAATRKETSKKIAVLFTPGNGVVSPVAQSAGWSFRFCGSNPLRFRYTVPQSSSGTVPLFITLFSLSGRPVCNLVNGVSMPGAHTVVWDGQGRDGSRVAKGAYIARIRGDSFSGSILVNLIR